MVIRTVPATVNVSQKKPKNHECGRGTCREDRGARCGKEGVRAIRISYIHVLDCQSTSLLLRSEGGKHIHVHDKTLKIKTDTLLNLATTHRNIFSMTSGNRK